MEAGNLLFIDNPVGTGFSFVANGGNFTSNNAEVAEDLLKFLQAFMIQQPQWQTAPLFVFCESYGGKMGVAFAKAIMKAQKENLLQVNLRCAGLHT